MNAGIINLGGGTMGWNRVIFGVGVAAILGWPVAAGAQQTQQAQQANKPPAMQHVAEGRAQCLMCHGGTMPNVKAAPANHAGRGNETCLWCHAKDAAMQTATPAAVPHVVKGREQCLMCHGGTMANMKKVPDNHQGIDNKNCTLCHVASAAAK
jgi:hypothetical protein